MVVKRSKARALVQLAETRLGEAYVFGARVPFDDPDWHGPWDCAEFATWLVKQTTGLLFGVTSGARPDAYSGEWLDWSRRVGTRITVDEAAATAGAFLLRAPGPGKIGHVALSADGLGGTIEAYSTRAGVIRNRAQGRRWDCGVLVPGIDYHGASTPAPIAVPQPAVFRRGSQGPRVVVIQGALAELGYDVGAVDGVFGPRTERAVAAFQRGRGLLIDGEVGEQTLAALGLA